MTHGDGWVERRTDGQRKWDQEGAAASKAPTLSSLVSGGKGGMTTIRASQGGARWITALWGGGQSNKQHGFPVPLVPDASGCRGHQLLLDLLALVPQQARGGKERKAPVP